MSNWLTVEESPFAWERDALDFVRERLPSQYPYYAWSNFEFIALDGSLNEVDLLVFSPQGFFLIEIKSRPGYLRGDAGTWIWEHEGRLQTLDNPLLLANRKAKRLKSLLEAQPIFQRRERPPFMETLVFCSAKGLQCELQGTAQYNVCLRDRPSSPGIMAAIQERDCLGLRQIATGTHDRAMMQRVQRAMEQAGIRRPQRYKQVGDYQLAQVIEQTDSYQDWQATHIQISKSQRRIRIYPVHSGAIADDRRMMQRAAEREFQLLEQLRHPGIVRCEHFMTHELGPALFFEQDAEALRLDHYLAQYGDQLDVQVRLNLLRQLAETIQFSHAHNVFHRALCPQSIWVTGVGQQKPRCKIFNWQVAYQEGGSTTGQSNQVTTHIDRLVEDQNTAYIAPEALTNPHLVGEYLDIFSLGAIAYFLFSGIPPAANGLELSQKLRQTKGLQISAVLNGAALSLEYLIDKSTQSSVKARYPAIADFLADLDDVEEELTSPEPTPTQHPADANKGETLPGGLEVVQRLGRGGCSVGLLVKQDEQLLVLKVASETHYNDRILAEANVIQKLRHPRIVELHKCVQIGDWWGFLMKPVFVQRDKQTIETLRQRLRREKTLQLDLLQRFGADLLEAVSYLEDVGYAHRDIKPDNIAVGQSGANGQLHLNLFDFSLAQTPIQNIRAGTSGYLDPFLPLRPSLCWDSAAERYAAAITLYEMATGDFPKWGDGMSDPSHLDCEITLDAEKFTQLRDRFLEFFQKAFRRDPAERFANAAEMLEQWRDCFRESSEPATSTWERLQGLIETLDLQTRLQALDLEAPLLEALDRANILTVQDLRDASTQKLMQLRGVVNQRRRDINELATLIRQRFTNSGAAETTPTATRDVARLSIDFLAQRVQATPKDGDTEDGVIGMLLGLANRPPSTSDPEPSPEPAGFWPSGKDIARWASLSGDRIGQVLEKFQKRWYRLPAITQLRTDVLEVLNRAGGVMTIAELAQSLLVARGSQETQIERRQQLAIAVLRVALEAEQVLSQPRFKSYHQDSRHLVATAASLADYAFQLGDCADRLAQADPLLSPARSLATLQEIPPPPDVLPLQENRLVILAAAASTHAALSSRQEFYPQNLAAERAIKLSQGALHGAPSLSIEQIQGRVMSRYPAAAPIPSRPHLDALLQAARLELHWDDAHKVYVPNPVLGTGLSSSRSLFSSTMGHSEASPLSAVSFTRQQFEARLERSLNDRTFLALTTTQEHYLPTAERLSDRFSVNILDFERLFLTHLQAVAAAARVNWDLVLQTDAQPHTGDWDKLLLLVRRTMEPVEAHIFTLTQPCLMIFPAMLARYNQMAFLERLRDRVGQGDTLPGFWLLVASDRAAIAGQVVPLLSPGQRVPVPRAWLRNP
ncbi:BREX system serine/threonine kinase PglW [Spirulina major CS-329]|uniref:BREX system serine/threonine kinase PglW n=1 Tax=Spirulina TaxID=1154 RepID=UPI00232B6A6E|nr:MULTISPECIES: BREX system serine/threonine kinase PglW [Spirulina]MDB9494416.1 BREX system serine/threonine kinase PglW [Spirulina subsalsa CS-330]MDB9503100.1 BREX system serine/threonine kinase PglW [Spirulina major CS-329]